jgi:hypothetical protein
MLYPDYAVTQCWELFITIILLLSCFLTPIDLAFNDIRPNYIEFHIIMSLIDVMFGIQIILTFFTATEDDNMLITEDYKSIAQ